MMQIELTQDEDEYRRLLDPLVHAARHVSLTEGYPAGVPSDHASIERWLLAGEPVLYGLARYDDAPRVPAGHLQVTEPLPYLRDQLEARGHSADGLYEVTKLFTAPWARNSGVARALVTAAIDRMAEAGRRPVLSVIDTWLPARRLYAEVGLTELFAFDGKDGRNIVMASGVPDGAAHREAPVGSEAPLPG